MMTHLKYKTFKFFNRTLNYFSYILYQNKIYKLTNTNSKNTVLSFTIFLQKLANFLLRVTIIERETHK